MSKTQRTSTPRTVPPNFVATYAALIPFVILFFPEITALADGVAPAGSPQNGDGTTDQSGLTPDQPPDRADHDS